MKIQKIPNLFRTKSKSKFGVSRIVQDNYRPNWYLINNQVRKRDKVCIQCGSSEDLEVHHFVPLSRGGRTELSNLGLLCENCHKLRHRHLSR